MADINLSNNQFLQEFNTHLGVEKFEELRKKLIRFFRFKLSSNDSLDDLVQETMVRVFEKISQGVLIENIDSYIFSVAKFVAMEAIRKDRIDSRKISLDDIEVADKSLASLLEKEEIKSENYCFKKCLANLVEADRDLLIEYFQDRSFFSGKNRFELAHKENRTISSLRIKIFRLRQRLQVCVKNCLEKK